MFFLPFSGHFLHLTEHRLESGLILRMNHRLSVFTVYVHSFSLSTLPNLSDLSLIRYEYVFVCVKFLMSNVCLSLLSVLPRPRWPCAAVLLRRAGRGIHKCSLAFLVRLSFLIFEVTCL